MLLNGLPQDDLGPTTRRQPKNNVRGGDNVQPMAIHVGGVKGIDTKVVSCFDMANA